MKIFENEVFDEERALYGSKNVMLRHCNFDGPADGESALKESSDVTVDDCYWNLRYPFWHVHELSIMDTELTSNCRAAIWYSDHIQIKNTRLYGIKALRECSDVEIADCYIVSPEFGWSVNHINMKDTKAESEYFMMRSKNLIFSNVTFYGKYSFQYIEDAVFEHCNMDTKDAFWHAKNVTIKDSIIKGEYLAWYCENVTFENCKIIGTQPLCYCKNLKLIQCEMIDTDLCFEKSEVMATITTPVISIKNPLSGCIKVPKVGEIIRDIPETEGEIVIES